MFDFLKYHPFAVKAFFESSIVLTYAVPKEELVKLIPPFLELDTHADRYGFVAVAMVQTKHLRPASFPRVLGNDFFLIGYRIFVRYTNANGKRMRGLYILKSETDKKRMEIMGNICTQYKYTTTDIQQQQSAGVLTISSVASDFEVEMNIAAADIALPHGSPFKDWKEARRFAGPLPFTFSQVPDERKVLIVEGVRENWQPAPVQVIKHHFSFLDSLSLKGAVLANAFIIKDIPYYWKKGKLEQWR